MTDIVITGIGVISPLGIGRKSFWENCRDAKSGIKKVTAFDTSSLRSDFAAFVEDFEPREYMSSRVYRRMGRISQMAVASSVEAIEDSGIDLDAVNKDRFAIIMGTAYGSSSSVEDFYASLLKEGPRGAQPFFFPETVPNAAASHVAIFHGITGPNTTFCQNEISAENAILYARNLLLQNHVDFALVGGADELSQILYTCSEVFLNKIKAGEKGPITPVPGEGFVLGEGSGILVLERSDYARARGAEIYGILKSGVLSGGMASMGHYEQSGEQMSRAMRLAVEQAGVSPGEIDQINVSANFSRELDTMEYNQLVDFFKKQNKELVVSPMKYLIGEFGGGGIMRAAATLLSLYHQAPLPTVSIDALLGEPQTPVVWHTHPEGRPATALMTSSTFGGGSASMVFGRNQ